MLINTIALIMLVRESKKSIMFYFSLLLFLDCASISTSNYTLTLDVSSHVVVQGEDFNYYVLAGEEVTLMATAHRNSNSSNSTDLTSELQVFYYNFQCRNDTAVDRWYPVNCSEESTVVKVWHYGGTVECSVQLLTQDNKTLACNGTNITIAGNVLIQTTGEILLCMLYVHITGNLRILNFTYTLPHTNMYAYVCD